jgi:hypothetical protein
VKRLHNGLLVLALIFSGCGAGEPPPVDDPSSAAGDSNGTSASITGLPAAKPMRGTGKLTPPENAEKFTFVVFGDNRPGKGEPQPETVHEIFAEIKQIKPAFAVSLGDIIEGKPQPGDPRAIDKMREQFQDFLELAAKAETPIYNAPGNHEMDDDQDIPTKRMHALYRESVGPTYGAFSYGRSRFILLNSEDVPAADTPKPPGDAEFSYISPKQIAELKADLDAHRDKRHIFISLHYPIHAKDEGPPDSQWDDRLYPESREALVELFENYDNIAYVLAAHEHLYYNPRSPDNASDVPGWKRGDPIVYLVSGGAGAPLNEGKWGFHHYLVFHVDGDAVSVELVKLESKGASS